MSTQNSQAEGKSPTPKGCTVAFEVREDYWQLLKIEALKSNLLLKELVGAIIEAYLRERKVI